VFKKILPFLEITIIALLGILVVSSPFEAITTTVPSLRSYVSLLVILVIGLVVIGNTLKPASPLSSLWITALSIITQFTLFLESVAPGSLTPPALLVMVVAGLLGRRLAWIIPFFIFTCSGTLRLAIMTVINNQPLSAEILLSAVSFDPLYYLYLVFAGLLPELLLASYRLRYAEPKNAYIPEQTSFFTTDAPQKSDSQKTKNQSVEPPSGTGLYNDERDVAELLSSVVYFMSRNFRSFSSLGFIFDPVRQVFTLNSFQSKSISIIKDVRIPIGVGVVGQIGTEKRSFMTGDLRVYNSELNYYSSEEQINSILAVPIISEQNELLGTLVLDSKDRQAFKDQDKDTLKRFSSLAAALITTARMRSFQERSARTFQTFYEASHQFTTALKPEHVYEVLFGVIPTITTCTGQLGIIFDQKLNIGRVTSVWGNSSDVVPGFTFPINAGLYSFTFQKRRIVSIADFQQFTGQYYRFTPAEAPNPAIRSLIIFPLLDDEQRCCGLFSVESSLPNSFPADTEQVLTTLIENANVAFIRAILYQRMERLATTDGLTGLNNHRHFQELLAQEMERSRRYQRPLALLLMDIDHFKNFNDTYGHPVGDLVLKEISLCIQRSIRCNDMPARYGGEEFVVIIPETTEEGALTTAERIRTTIEKNTIVSLGRQLKVTVSIGCSAFPENAPSQQVLIDTADKALYAAKKDGRNRVVLYRDGM
jgi:diguanylate cyclase (GGDEF)-like protein